MKHIFSFTTERYLRELDKCFLHGKLEYMMRASKFPWMEIGAYTTLAVIMVLIGQMSELIMRMIPLVVLVGLGHVTVSMIRSLKYRRQARKFKKPYNWLKKQMKPFFKIRLIPNQLSMTVILIQDDLSETDWELPSSELTNIDLSAQDYFQIHTKKVQLIVPRSLFTMTEYEDITAPYRQAITTLNHHDHVHHTRDEVDAFTNQVPMLTEMYDN